MQWDANNVLSYLKSLGRNGSLSLKQLTLKTTVLLPILPGRRILTLHMISVIHMDQFHDKVIFYIIGLIKCSNPSRQNQPVVYREYVEDELLCPVGYIYACLAQISEIVTQDFTEFFTTLNKPTHLASKDSLAQRVKKIIRNSGIDREIFKPHSTSVAGQTVQPINWACRCRRYWKGHSERMWVIFYILF